jgi:ribose 5-phosphate isomerase A
LSQHEQKKRAAAAALSYLEDGIVLGVGTGSTVEQFIDMLPPHAERLTTVVSSSNRSTDRLERLGVEVSPLSAVARVDLYVDGADEATKRLHLLKGGGGALTREKVLAGAARRFVCIVDESKLVAQLGRFPLPIEVVPVAETFVSHQLLKAKGRPVVREGYVTDNGNHIIDVHELRIANPLELETRLNQIPGIVTVGLFAHRGADVLLIGRDDGVKVME